MGCLKGDIRDSAQRAIIQHNCAIAVPPLVAIFLSSTGPRWHLKIQTLLVLATLCAPFQCNAQDVTAAKESAFQEIFATRKSDVREYIVSGSGWLRPIQSGKPG